MTDKPRRTRKQNNKIHTAGYFVKRLKDAGFVVWRMFHKYGDHDPRRWTVLVDPGVTSVFITCFENRNHAGEIMFEINDGGVKFPKNLSVLTQSIEVVVNHLVEAGIPTSENNPFREKTPELQ